MSRVSPSIRMVADAAGVSVATVSNVLNGKKSVAPELATRVQATIDQLGYVRDNRASRLRSGQSRLAGAIVPDLTNPMFASFVSTLEHMARTDGYDLVVVSSGNDPAEEAVRLSHIREWRPAGLIVIPCDGALADRLPIGSTQPMVVADRIPDEARFDLVAVDNAAASESVSRHFAQAGHPDCLVVGTSITISNIRERWEGAVAGAGRMRLDLMQVGFEDHGPPALETRLRGPGRPSCIFCLDHETTLATYRMLRELKIEVGRDMGFASFDEMEWMRLVAPAVTAVRQPVEEMAECAWTMLRRRIGGDVGPPLARRLRCTVTFRGSSPRPATSPESEADQTKAGGKSL